MRVLAPIALRLAIIALLSASTGASGQVALAHAPPAQLAPLDPAADYVTAGQDEPGYRAWATADPSRPPAVASFYAYLVQRGVAGVLPTWQLLRSASAWQRCGAQPFEVPPETLWPNLIETLNYIHADVVPVVGPVEPVSVYRNPLLNACAGGAPESAHAQLFAIDLVPLRPTEREGLVRSLCTIHQWRGTAYDVGLGFYKGLRFHVDSKKFREWGGDGRGDTSPCISIAVQLDPLAPAPAKPPGPPSP